MRKHTFNRGTCLILENHCNIWCFFTFLLALIPRLILIKDTLPVRTVSDEIATISGAAYFAGYDWSEVISHAGYYGQGFYSLFFWVFKITDNPIVIYHIILSACAFLQACIVPIIFYLIKKYLCINSNLLTSLISLIGSYLTIVRVAVTYNENILVVLCWIITFFIFQYFDASTQRMKYIYYIVISILIGWGITIHIRFLVFIIALILATIVYKIYYKSSITHLIMLLGLPVFIVPSYFFVEKVKNILWKAGENSQTIRNTTVNLDANVNILDSTSWKAFFNIILGQINTITIFTCGFFVLSVVSILYYLKKNKDRKHSLKYKQILFVSATLLFAIGGTILAQSLSWMENVYNALNRQGIEADIYSYKAFTYIRYFGIYVGPLVVIGVSVLCKELVDIRTCVKVSWLTIIGLQVYWLSFIQKYISNNIHAKEVFISFSRWTSNKQFYDSIYLFGVSFVLIFYFILYLLICKKQWWIILSFTSIILIYEYMYVGYKQDIVIQANNYEKVDKSYAFLRDAPIDETEDIYYIDLSNMTDHNTYYLLQMYLPRYKIIPKTINFVKENAIIISNGNGFMDNNHYIFMYLDDKEYIYILGEENIESFKEYLEEATYEYEEIGK